MNVIIKENVIIKDYSKSINRWKKQRFEKEKEIYELLEGKSVATPKLVATKHRTITLEYIPAVPITIDDNKKIVDILLGFQFSDIQPKKGWIISLLLNPFIQIPRFCFSGLRTFRPKSILMAVGVFINYYLTVRPLQHKILIHNDFTKKNILNSGKKIYLIDFENTITSHRWLFNDIVAYIYNPELNTDYKIINLYIENLKRQMPKYYENINVKKELRVSLLRHLISRSFSGNRKKNQIIFFEHLLNRQNYDKWFKGNINS